MKNVIKFSLSIVLASQVFSATTIIVPSRSVPLNQRNDDTEDVQIIPLAWPDTPRPTGNAGTFTREFDGFTELLFKFSLPGFTFQTEPFGDWKAIPVGNRYSILLRNVDNSVSFGISQFKKKEFLTSLKNEDWERYTYYLQISNPHLSIQSEDSNLESDDGLFVFGKKYREIFYEIHHPMKPPILVQEIFTFINDQLTVFTIKGTKDDVIRSKGATHAMICRMGYPEDL